MISAHCSPSLGINDSRTRAWVTAILSSVYSDVGALWAMGRAEESSLLVVSCRFHGCVWWRAHADAPAPGKLEWRDNTELEAIARPRSWRPLRKRDPSCWESSGEAWSETDTIRQVLQCCLAPRASESEASLVPKPTQMSLPLPQGAGHRPCCVLKNRHQCT